MVMLLLRPFCLFFIISTKLQTGCLVHHLLSISTAAEEEHVRSAAVSQPFIHAGGANNAVAQKKVLRPHSILHSSISERFFWFVFLLKMGEGCAGVSDHMSVNRVMLLHSLRIHYFLVSHSMLLLFFLLSNSLFPPPNSRTPALKPRVEMMMESTAEYN